MSNETETPWWVQVKAGELVPVKVWTDEKLEFETEWLPVRQIIRGDPFPGVEGWVQFLVELPDGSLQTTLQYILPPPPPPEMFTSEDVSPWLGSVRYGEYGFSWGVTCPHCRTMVRVYPDDPSEAWAAVCGCGIQWEVEVRAIGRKKTE